MSVTTSNTKLLLSDEIQFEIKDLKFIPETQFICEYVIVQLIFAQKRRKMSAKV